MVMQSQTDYLEMIRCLQEIFLFQLDQNLPQPQAIFLCTSNIPFKAQLKPTHFREPSGMSC